MEYSTTPDIHKLNRFIIRVGRINIGSISDYLGYSGSNRAFFQHLVQHIIENNANQDLFYHGPSIRPMPQFLPDYREIFNPFDLVPIRKQHLVHPCQCRILVLSFLKYFLASLFGNKCQFSMSLPDLPLIDHLDFSHTRKNLNINDLLFPAL